MKIQADGSGKHMYIAVFLLMQLPSRKVPAQQKVKMAGSWKPGVLGMKMQATWWMTPSVQCGAVARWEIPGFALRAGPKHSFEDYVRKLIHRVKRYVRALENEVLAGRKYPLYVTAVMKYWQKHHENLKAWLNDRRTWPAPCFTDPNQGSTGHEVCNRNLEWN